MFTTRSTVKLSALACLAAILLTLAPTPSSACYVSPEEMVRFAIADYLWAAKQGEEDLRAHHEAWLEDMRRVPAVTVDASGAMRVETLAATFQRWSTDPDPTMSWKVLSSRVIADRIAVVSVEIARHDATYTAHLSLARDGERFGSWQLTGQLLTIHAAKNPAASAAPTPAEA